MNVKDLRALSAMLGDVTSHNREFLDTCIETRLLAVSDIDRATREYDELARMTLQNISAQMSSHNTCRELLSEASKALQRGCMSSDYVTALRMLRDTFLREILRPTVADFLKRGEPTSRELERLYSDQIKIDTLLETAQFLQKTRRL